MKSIVIALLDKTWPPEHSFVDGMLAGVAAKQPGINVRLCVSRGLGLPTKSWGKVRRYNRAACLECMYPRRGFGRLLNLWRALSLTAYQIAREHKRGRRVVIFVRNDPVYLLAASLLRRRLDRLVFQSSFPHEELDGNTIRRIVAKAIYRMASSGVHAVTAVSPIGLVRVRKLCPRASVAEYIPLLSDLPLSPMIRARGSESSERPVTTFVYVGTHCRERELEVVLSGIVKAVGKGAEARFLFVGGTDEEVQALTKDGPIDDLVERGAITFKRRISRNQIPEVLSRADVGISLIPLRRAYYESSPTKLAEYMGAGLAVLASRGIPMQEKFVTEGRAGILSDWDSSAIAATICEMAADRDKLARMKQQARHYAETHLQYSAYTQQFARLIHG